MEYSVMEYCLIRYQYCLIRNFKYFLENKPIHVYILLGNDIKIINP